MRSKIILIVVLLALGFGVGRLSAAGPLAPGGSLDSPGPPESTYLYTLEDIYNRLLSGAAGAPTTFTEPSIGPTAGTGHTLHEIMAQAPAVDDANGATSAEVARGKTAWGLTSGQWGLLTGTADIFINFAPVPKTGQAKCYNTVGTEISCTDTGQDGDYQNGIAWPNPRFTDNGDNMVTDNLTGLIWLKNANCAAFSASDTTGQNDREWSAALAAANSLADGFCGLTDGSVAGDWRLPNVRELQSLAHYGFYNPAVPDTAGTGQWSEGDSFSGVQSYYYWSSTTYAYDASNAWYVILATGRVSAYYKTDTYYVWPVRGGQ